MALDLVPRRAGLPAALLLALLPATARAQDAVTLPAAPTITLAEALARTEGVQPSVVAARAQIRTADAQKRAAFGAYLPNVTATSSGGYLYAEGQGRVDPVTGVVVGGNTSNKTLSMGVNASVDLFTGFRRGADSRAARAGQDAANAGFLNARWQARLTVTSQFLSALQSAQLVDVRQASLRRAEEQFKQSVARVRAGTATRSDSLRASVGVGNAQVALASALSDLAGAEAGLARLVGTEGRLRAADDSLFHAPVAPFDTAALREDARRASPQVQSTAAQAAQARAQLTSAKSAYWPTLSLGGSWTYNGSSRVNDYQLFNQRQLSLSLSWPLFNRFIRERNIATQVSNLEAAEATAADAVRQVDAALTAQLAALDAAALRVQITRSNLAASQEDLRVQQERYRLGAATYVDVLTSQEALTQAEVDAVTARITYLQTRASIEALIGRTL